MLGLLVNKYNFSKYSIFKTNYFCLKIRNFQYLSNWKKYIELFIYKNKLFKNSFFLFIGIFIPFVANSQELTQQIPKKENNDVILKIEKIEINHDDSLNTYNELLSPLKNVEYNYEPFIKTFDVFSDLSFVLQYALDKFAHKDFVLNPEFGAGILFKKGIYCLISGGYSKLECNTVPRDDSSFLYDINGPFFNLGLGWKFEYFRYNLIGFIFKYGGTFYNKLAEIHNININININDNYAHWIKLIVDIKSKIFRNYNFYLGVDMGLKILLSDFKSNTKLDKFMLPHYGMNTNKIGLTFGFNLQYSFHFYRKFISISS